MAQSRVRKIDPSCLVWTEAEIVKSYKEAMFPQRQINVLADLNDCDPVVIRAVLHKAGITIPRKKKRPQTKKPTSSEIAQERLRQGFGRACKIAFEREGVLYTTKQVMAMTGKSQSRISAITKDVDECVIDGIAFRIKRFVG